MCGGGASVVVVDLAIIAKLGSRSVIVESGGVVVL